MQADALQLCNDCNLLTRELKFSTCIEHVLNLSLRVEPCHVPAGAAASPATPRQPLQLMPTGKLRLEQEQPAPPWQHVHQHSALRPNSTASSRPLSASERDMDLPDLVNLKVPVNSVDAVTVCIACKAAS